MATEADYALLREETGLTLAEFDDIAAAAVYAQVALQYPAGSAAVIYAAARVSVLLRRMASFATQTSYAQNQESEDLSDAFDNLEKLLAYWERKLTEALADEAQGTGIHPPPSGSVRLRAVF